MKEINKNKLYNFIKENDNVTRKDIVRKSGIQVKLITTLLKMLEKEGKIKPIPNILNLRNPFYKVWMCEEEK